MNYWARVLYDGQEGYNVILAWYTRSLDKVLYHKSDESRASCSSRYHDHILKLPFLSISMFRTGKGTGMKNPVQILIPNCDK